MNTIGESPEGTTEDSARGLGIRPYYSHDACHLNYYHPRYFDLLPIEMVLTIEGQSSESQPFVWYKDGDFQLTQVSLPYSELPPDQILQHLSFPVDISIRTLCAALQNGCSLPIIKSYLDSYRYDDIKSHLASSEKSWPALFYAAERNSPDAVLALLEYGADPLVVYTTFHLPVLAFAIIHGKQMSINSTEVVKVLLAFGVDPKIIPEDMWANFLEAPQATASNSFQDSSSPSAWCSPRARFHLAPALHLTHRYLLYQANRFPRFNGRTLQIANAHKMINLLKIPYHLIGQVAAGRLVMDNVYAHIAWGQEEPLVMAFAGPSGHGKTEMAKQMGDLLSVSITTIDCTQFHADNELFGPRAGYSRSGEGSQLNNFLSDNDGRRAVVFLDEFDKTSQDVRHSLLLLCDSGVYFDRRSNTQIDCSKTLWIIATNLGDASITRFYDAHIEIEKDDKKNDVDIRPLQAQLRSLFRSRFGAPFTGRINLIVPFLPFSASERAVVAHKFILKLADRVRQPLDLRSEANRYIGHCQLSIHDDGKVCNTIAEQSYDRELGARSLYHAVNNIKRQFVTEYRNVDKLVTEETNAEPLTKFTIKLVPVGKDVNEVGVCRDKVEEMQNGTGVDGTQRSGQDAWSTESMRNGLMNLDDDEI